MINELRQLAIAMEKNGVSVQHWHRKYNPIPKVNEKNPCIQFILSGGSICEIRSVEKQQAKGIRRYGTNQGLFPGLNLIPLYRVTDETIKKELRDLKSESLNEMRIKQIKSWCEENNWNRKFLNKYKISMESVPGELEEKLKEKRNCEELFELIAETEKFRDPECMRRELEKIAFENLQKGVDISLAIRILFHFGKKEKSAEADVGTLSVILDSQCLLDKGFSSAGSRFTKKMNAALMDAEVQGGEDKGNRSRDAFGQLFAPLDEPMPTVKLAGGMDVSLRTMFREQRCQERYGRIENASYPISPELRTSLQSALFWLGAEERKGKTWINTDRNEILFAYPYRLPETAPDLMTLFGGAVKASFEAEAQKFLDEFEKVHVPGEDSHAERIQLFVLRKIDKARTKVVYSRVTDPIEIEKQSEAWSCGCRNLPRFPFGEPFSLFPVRVADVLNRVWKKDGTMVTDKFKPIPRYRGIELLLEPAESTHRDLYMLVKNSGELAPHLGRLAIADRSNAIWWKAKDMLSLLGLLLYRKGIRKEQYMEKIPYLYGQLLKISDELHALYCNVVRDGSVPTQLVGSGLYQSATETPIRTLKLLGQRMNPYIAWAKSYRTKKVFAEGEESWKAGWLLSLYEKTASALYADWAEPEAKEGSIKRFDDAEKAQLFIGYLAAFPQNTKKARVEEEYDA